MKVSINNFSLYRGMSLIFTCHNAGSLPPLEPSTPAIPTARKNVEIGKEICRQLGIEARNESGVLPSMGVTISEKAKQRGDSEA